MTPAPLVEANGASIPALGFGTWPLKGEACATAVGTALSVGYRHLDTAAMYDNEAAVGEGLRASGVSREDVFVTTKVWYTDLASGRLEASAEASLKNLGLDQVNLLLIHWPNPDLPVTDGVKALCNAKRRGLTRHIGISNFTTALLEEAVRTADEPLVVNQCEYHPALDQSRVIAACRRHGMAFTSYSPLGKGELLDTPTIRGIAASHGRTPGQVVLRWHMQQPGVIAIPKSANPERIRANFEIFDFTLDASEMAAISALARPDGRMISPGWAPAWDEAA